MESLNNVKSPIKIVPPPLTSTSNIAGTSYRTLKSISNVKQQIFTLYKKKQGMLLKDPPFYKTDINIRSCERVIFSLNKSINNEQKSSRSNGRDLEYKKILRDHQTIILWTSSESQSKGI